MKQNSPSMVPQPANRPILRWYLPPVVRTYEQIASILAQRGRPQVTPAQVQQVCETVSLKIRLGS